jgi:predicted enzyme related to lactoylglutathione lyase
VHFEVVGKDAQTLQSFYKNAFEWQIQPAIPGYAMAHPGGDVGINGGIGAAMGGGAGHVTFYVAVPDLEAALSKIESLGGSTVVEPTDVPEGPSIAMFADPESHPRGSRQGRLVAVVKSALKDYLGASKYRPYFEATPNSHSSVCLRMKLPATQSCVGGPESV